MNVVCIWQWENLAKLTFWVKLKSCPKWKRFMQYGAWLYMAIFVVKLVFNILNNNNNNKNLNGWREDKDEHKTYAGVLVQQMHNTKLLSQHTDTLNISLEKKRVPSSLFCGSSKLQLHQLLKTLIFCFVSCFPDYLSTERLFENVF